MSCAADLGPSLLWTPCDPGEVRAAAVPCMLAQHRPCYEPSGVRLARRWQCHIYFSQQRKALGTAIALASELKRTLVLPPFEWYSGQAQLMANAFRATDDGRTPRFTPWSQLFDIEPLRRHVPVVELHELHTGPEPLEIQSAIYATGTAVSPNDRKMAAEGEDGALQGMLAEKACKDRSSQGLLKNLTRAGGAGPWDGRVLGGALRVAAMRCGMLMLDKAGAAGSVGAWFGDAPMVAVFSVGHYEHAKLPSRPSVFTPPAAALQQEADRYVAELRRARGAGAGAGGGEAPERKFVALHWRHGDYVPYRTVSSAEAVAKDATRALEAIHCPACPLFLMTNCRDTAALEELGRLLPTLARYAPPEDRPEFSDEGPRLVIEQAIATHAERFVGTGRSAVTLFVEEARRQRPLEPVALPGR